MAANANEVQRGLSRNLRCKEREIISERTTKPTPGTHARNAVVEDKRIGCRDLGVVDCKHCRAAEYGVVAELTDGHAVAVWIPKTSAAHVDTFTFLLAHNHLNKGGNIR